VELIFVEKFFVVVRMALEWRKESNLNFRGKISSEFVAQIELNF
jgi:hypothetical protein